MKKVYETPMTDLIVVDLYDRLCDPGVVSPGDPTDEPDTNVRNSSDATEEIWNKEW